MIRIAQTKERYEKAVAGVSVLRQTPFVQLLHPGNPYETGVTPGGHSARLEERTHAEEYSVLQALAISLNSQIDYLDSFAEARDLTIEDVVSDLNPNSIFVQPPIVSVTKFKQAYKNQEIAETAVDMLAEKGVLPFTYLSPAFTVVNTLVAAVLWGGTKSYYQNSIPYVQVGNEATVLLQQWGEELGITRGFQRKNHFQINGGEFPRLLDCIPGLLKYKANAKRNTKAHARSLLPSYLSNMLFDNHGGITKEVVKEMCRDQASIYILSKRIPHLLTEYTMSTIGREMEEQAKELWNQVYAMFRKGFPWIIKPNQLEPKVKQKDVGLWEGIITLEPHQISHLVNEGAILELPPSML